MRIDAHQHFWRLVRGDYGWLTKNEHPAIHRDFLPDDLVPLIKDAAIERTILIQAAPSAAETAFLLELSNSAPFVGGIVGWTDFEAPDAAETIARLAGNRKLVGLRPMLQDLSDDEWLLGPRIAAAVDSMRRTGLRFDALIKPRHLRVLQEFARRNPDLPIVIDHGAKPDIRSGERREWAKDIEGFSRLRNTVCKLSGLVTEAGSSWSTESLKPYVDVLLDVFGPGRLMWGSDWPVLNEASDYLSWLNVAQTLTGHLDFHERDLIFGDTAASFYGVAR